MTSHHMGKRHVVRLVILPLARTALHAILATLQEEPVVVHYLNKRHALAVVGVVVVPVRAADELAEAVLVTGAALLVLAARSRPLALELALGAWALAGLTAFPGAVRFLAHWAALRLRRGASGMTLPGGAHGLTLRASLAFTHVSRASNAANWPLAVHRALGTRGLLAADFAQRLRAHRVAEGRADRVVA